MALGNASDVVVGLGMMAMMFLFWVLFIVGLVVGIRWSSGKGNEQKQDWRSVSYVRDMRAARSTVKMIRGREDLGG